MPIFLDPMLRNLRPGGVLNLTHGEYTTMGCDTFDMDTPKNRGVYIPEGVKIIGHPYGQTIIKCIRPNDSDVTILHGRKGCVFKDFEVVCSEPLTTGNLWKRSGVRVDDEGIIENVKVKNSYGQYKEGRESFGIVAKNGLVRNCVVSDIQGDYTSAIIGKLVEYNHVEWRNAIDDSTPGFRVAYNIGDSKNSIVRFNSCKNANSAIYGDYKICEGTSIYNNIFNNVRVGLHLNAQTNPHNEDVTGFDTITYLNNVMRFQTTGKMIAEILLDHTNTISDNKIINYRNYIKNIHSDNNTVDLPFDHKVQYPYTLNCASFIKDVSDVSDTCGIQGILMIKSTQLDTRTKLKVRNRLNLGVDMRVIGTDPAEWITSY